MPFVALLRAASFPSHELTVRKRRLKFRKAGFQISLPHSTNQSKQRNIQHSEERRCYFESCSSKDESARPLPAVWPQLRGSVEEV